MSDNFHDAFEDGIRDNAGHLALAGALFAHSQRKQQLQSLEASRQHQAQIAKTEAQRLDIEKQRLELKKLKQQAEKDEKEAVRLLRVMMAEVGLALDSFMSRGELKGSPIGPRRDYIMAVLMSKLALVRSRSASLSDLSDLKELARLEELSEDLISKHFPGGEPLEITRAKWRELQDWMDGVDPVEKELQQACAAVPDPTALQLPAKAELETRQRKLEEFAAALSGRLNDHVSRLPADAAANGVLTTELAEQAQLEELAAGKQAIRAKAFANSWHQVTKGFLQLLNASLRKLHNLQSQHVEHDKTLQKLGMQIEHGDLCGADKTAQKLGVLRFGGLNYGLLPQLLELQGWCRTLALANRDQVLRISEELKNKCPKANNSSELGLLIIKHQQRAGQEKRASMVRSAFTLGLSSVFEKLKDQAFQKKMSSHRELAQRLNVWEIGTKVGLPLTSKTQQIFCFIPCGTFAMGSHEDEERGDDSFVDQVDVVLTKSFWLAKTEVTQEQWKAVMNSNPSHFKGANLPVENVSWEDAQAFIAKLNDKQILPEGWKFALPTEAQWEYACRAGEKRPYSGGSLDEVGWYDDNSGSQTHEVAKKKPNAWGLYDMHGNVNEWCADWFEDLLKGGTDPAGPSSGINRVIRGGSWNCGASDCSAADRGGNLPGYRYYDLGFRPALVQSR